MPNKIFTVYQSSKEGLPIQLCTASESKALKKMKEHDLNTIMMTVLDTEPAEYRSYLTVESFENDFGS